MDYIPNSILYKLKALNYPRLPITTIDLEEFCLIVTWLEEEIIRSLKISDRSAMRQDFDTITWHKEITKYYQNHNIELEKLESNNTEQRCIVLNILLSEAVHITYQDKLEEQNGNFPLSKSPPNETSDNQEDLKPLKFKINNLLEKFNLPPISSDINHSELLSALKAISWHIPYDASKKIVNIKDLKLPNNYTEKSSEFQIALSVLRILHGNSLSEFQRRINEFINDLQKIISHSQTFTQSMGN